MLPVDQVHRLVRLAGGDLHRHAVAQELVGAQVGLVERDAGRVGGGLQLLQGGGDVGGGVAAGRQVVAQQRRLDGAVVLPLVPLAEVAVAEAVGPRRVGEQGDDAVLRLALGAGLLRHGPPPVGTSRVLPVSSSCIMACLRSRVLSRRASSADSSASMSESTAAMAVCSGSDGSWTSSSAC